MKHWRDDIYWIPNGMDLNEFKSAAKHNKIPGRILFAGRLEPMKGVDMLLDAFAIAAEQHPSISLRISGDGSERKSLERKSKELGISNKVEFLGYLRFNELLHEYANAEIFCGLSRTEAFGNVFVEAQAAGCAVIATNVDGIPKVVDDGAILVELGQKTKFEAANAISKLLLNKKKKMQIVRDGMKNSAMFNWEQIAYIYSLYYEKVLEEALN